MGGKKAARSRFSFTVKRLEKLAPPAGRDRVYHYDAGQPGLCLCVTAAGARTFYVYRKVDGRPERVRLGAFPEISIDTARDAAMEILGEIAKGRDPAAERRARRESPTVKELFDHWLKNHAKPRKKTWRDDQRIFDKYFTTLSGRRLDKLKPADVKIWHVRLGENHGNYQANRCRALLSAMWAAADDLGVRLPNPCTGVRRFKEESRDRFLLPEEMRRFFEALAKEDPLWRDFFLLALFTGARRGNVAAMRWDQLDLVKGLWYLPGSVMKNGRPMVVVLAEPAQAVLTSRSYVEETSPWVFPAKGRSGEGRIVDPRKAWERVKKAATIGDLRMHDLRRSLGSWQAAAGASLAIIGKALGHRDHKATEVYARLQLDPVRASVEQATRAMRQAGGLLKNEMEASDHE